MDILKLQDPAATPAGFSFFEDFNNPGSTLTLSNHLDSLTQTVISSGTVAQVAAKGGWAALSGAATTDDSGAQAQGAASHNCVAGKFIGFKTRFQLAETTSTNSATESEWMCGLFIIDTNIFSTLPTDGVYFQKADGATAITANVRVGGVATSVTLVGVEDKAVHTYGIAVFPAETNANSEVSFSRDGVEVARIKAALPASTAYLAPSIGFLTGDNTGTKLMNVDYIGSYQDR